MASKINEMRAGWWITWKSGTVMSRLALTGMVAG